MSENLCILRAQLAPFMSLSKSARWRAGVRPGSVDGVAVLRARRALLTLDADVVDELIAVGVLLDSHAPRWVIVREALAP